MTFKLHMPPVCLRAQLARQGLTRLTSADPAIHSTLDHLCEQFLKDCCAYLKLYYPILPAFKAAFRAMRASARLQDFLLQHDILVVIPVTSYISIHALFADFNEKSDEEKCKLIHAHIAIKNSDRDVNDPSTINKASVLAKLSKLEAPGGLFSQFECEGVGPVYKGFRYPEEAPRPRGPRP
jgi:hypothetical protein